MPKDKMDDLLDGILDTKEDDDEGDVITAEEKKVLQDELAALKKENHGLLTTVKKERGKRQSSDGQLKQLTETVNGIITEKRAEPADPEIKPAETNDGLRVLYNDDGEPYLPTEAVNSLFTQQQKEINELKNALQLTNQAASATADADRAKLAIIGEDEAFGAAHSKYQTARSWIEGKVNQWQINNNVVGQDVTSGQALDYIIDEDMRTEFKTLYPDVDMLSVVTGEDSKAHFRQMLETLSAKEDDTIEVKKPDSRFQQVLNKPSLLGKTANAKAEPTIVEKVGSLSASDIGALTDAQVTALEKAMLREENEGIEF